MTTTEIIATKRSICGQRHLLALLISCVIAIACAVRASMSVAIVAMVNATALHEDGSQNHPNRSLEMICQLDIESPSNGSLPSHRTDGKLVWSRQLQGFILSAFHWGYLFLQLPGGYLAQRFGGKWVLSVAILVSSIITMVSPFTVHISPYLFMTFRFLEGVAQGVMFPALTAMLGRWTPRGEETFLIMITIRGVSVGAIVGQVIAGPLCDSRWGWPAVFYVTGAAGIVWLLPWTLLVSSSPESHPRISEAERALIAENHPHANQQASKRHSVPWLKILSDPAVWATIVGQFMCLWIYCSMVTCMPQFLSDVLRLGIMKNSLVSALPSVVTILVGIIVATVVDCIIHRHPNSKLVVRKTMNTIGFVVSGGSLLAATFNSCNEIIAIFLLVTSVSGLGFLTGSLDPNILDLSPEFCGSITGFLNLFGTVTAIVTPIMTDTLTTRGTPQEWNYVFYSGVVAAVLGILVFLLFGKAERRPWSIVENTTVEVEDEEIERLVQ